MSRAGLAVALTPRQGGGVLMRVCVQPCCAFSVAPTQPFGRVLTFLYRILEVIFKICMR